MVEAQKTRKEKELGLTGFILKPMWLTLKQTIKATINRPQTVLYPWEKLVLPDVYRGRPGLRFDKCIGCGICVRICPTRCIDLVLVDDLKKEEGKPAEKVKRPRLNLGRADVRYCESTVDQGLIVSRSIAGAWTREVLHLRSFKLQYEGRTWLLRSTSWSTASVLKNMEIATRKST
jgi:NADH-quinone oxidoreductase subunit I/NAD(P)H-quinone oxidoreductase subunit I